jgi:hypothetical protein
LAAAEGGDGIHEFVIVDPALPSISACTTRGNAELLLGKNDEEHATYTTEDTDHQVAAMVPIAISGISTTLPIQQVRVYWVAGRKRAQLDVTAAAPFKTLEQVLADLRSATA